MVFLIKTAQFILAITLLVALHEGGHCFFAKLFKTRVSRFYIFANWKFHLWSSYDNWWRRLLHKPLVEERDHEPDANGVKPLHFFQELKNRYYTLTGQKDRVNTEAGGNKLYNDSVGTEYGIGWLPIGGYCQIDGMVDETQSAEELEKKPVQPWEFRAKAPWQRLLIMAGGVMVNFVLALFIYAMVLFTWGDQYIATKDMTEGMKFNESALALGFQDHDILLGTEQGDFKDFSADLYRDLSSAHECRILRNGQPMTIALPGDLNLLDMMKASPSFVRPFVPAEVDSVAADSPAMAAGITKGDKIVGVAGKAITSYNEYQDHINALTLKMKDAKTDAQKIALRKVSIAIQHADGKVENLNVTLTEELTLGYFNKNVAGLYTPTQVDYGFLESFPAGVKYGLNVLSGYVGDLKYVFTADGAKSLGGFGTIGNLFPAQWNWHLFWMMTAFLSIILAFMNIIPIPGLDGGHILILLIEVLTGKTVNPKYQEIAGNIGFGFLLILMVVANLNDILRWLGIM